MVSPLEQLLAIVTDEPLKVDAPQFSRGEIQKIADLIEQRILTHDDNIDLLINGAYIPTSPFFRNLLTRTLIAMASGLNGVKEIKSLHISLRRKP